MSTGWLNDQLLKMNNIVTDGGNPVLTVSFGRRSERVYCPSSDEYRVTAETVQKAKGLGATLIAYSESWSGATYDATEYAKETGVSIMPYKSFFAYLRRHGVRSST